MTPMANNYVGRNKVSSDKSDKSDQERIKRAFNTLRKQGYFARMKFSCCMSCGSSEIYQIFEDSPEKYPDKKYVFYHAQDADAYDKHKNFKNLMIRWAGNPKEIVQALLDEGLDITWSGSEYNCIIAHHTGNPSNPTFKPDDPSCLAKKSDLNDKERVDLDKERAVLKEMLSLVRREKVQNKS